MADARPSPEPFVGRPETRESLRRRLAETRAGGGGVTVLVGETGVGKSTLIAELVAEARARSVRTLVGCAPALDDPPPYALLRSAVESAADDPQLREDRAPADLGGSPMLGFAPGLGGADLPVPKGIEGRLLDVLGWSSPDGAPTADSLLSSLADRLLEYSRHGPTLLVLEDLHRADRPSIAAVEFFARELAGRPLWILATSRPADTLSAAGRQRLERFEREAHADRVALRPMNSSETAEFLRRDPLGRALSDEEVARRFSETGGNPHLLRQLEHRRPGGDAEAGEAEAPVRDRRLNDEEREVVDLAAVLGTVFPFSLLVRAGDLDEERLAEVVDRLVARGVLFERPGELLEFPEERRREEAYNLLPERRRRALHRRAGSSLESMGPLDDGRVGALARHFYYGREARPSVRYNRQAAEIAERALAPEVAWEHCVRALESQRLIEPADPETEADLVLRLAQVSEELGVLADAETVLREFFDRTPPGGPLSAGRRATLEVFLSRILTDRGSLPEAAALARKVLETPGLEEYPLVRVGGHHQLGMTFYYEGRYAEALEQHTREVELAERLANPLVHARARLWRVANLAMLGETARAIAEARALTEERDRLGSIRESAQAHLFLGDILADARSPPEDRRDAMAEFLTSIRFAEQAKDPRRVAWANYKLAELLREAARLDEATERADRAVHVMGQVGDRVGLCVARKVRGQIALDRGDLDRAQAELDEAFGLLAGTEHRLEEIDVGLQRARLDVARGDRPGARALLDRIEQYDIARLRPDLLPEAERLRASLRDPEPDRGRP